MSQNTSVPAKSSAKLSAIVQQECFDVAELQRSLLGEAHEEGAIATFTGYVRSSNDSRTVDTLELEHYPGMTQKSIVEILEEAAARWPLLSASVVHRVGLLQPGDPIVWVGAASPHRVRYGLSQDKSPILEKRGGARGFTVGGSSQQ
jgi:molybdopterin synthase catalytic subunit